MALTPEQIKSGTATAQMTDTEAAKIESERLFASVMDEVSSKSEERVMPKRLVDELKDENKSKLIHSAVGIVNAIREKAGLAKLADLPRARPGEAGSCLLARAFDQKASVGGGGIEWQDEKMAKAAAEVLGTGGDSEDYGMNGTRNPGTFQQIVNQFDSHELRPYETTDEVDEGGEYDATAHVDTL